MTKVKFLRENHEVTVNSGTNLRQLALKNNYGVYQGMRKLLNCRGLGLCGTCVVEITDGQNGLSPVTRGEEKLLRKQNLEPGKFRLSCQTYVHGKVSVKTLG